MSNVFLQVVTEPGKDDWARRVSQDGTYAERTSVLVTFADAGPEFGTQPLEWRARGRLPSLGPLEELITSSGVLAEAGAHAPTGTVVGGGATTLTFPGAVVELAGPRTGYPPGVLAFLDGLDAVLQPALDG